MDDPRVALIVDLVARRYEIAPEAITSRDVTKPTREARMVAMVLVRDLLKYGATKTGQAFRRDHTTVLHAWKVVGNHLDKVHGWAEHFAALRTEAEQAVLSADIVITACDALRSDLLRRVTAAPAAALSIIVDAFNREDRA